MICHFLCINFSYFKSKEMTSFIDLRHLSEHHWNNRERERERNGYTRRQERLENKNSKSIFTHRSRERERWGDRSSLSSFGSINKISQWLIVKLMAFCVYISFECSTNDFYPSHGPYIDCISFSVCVFFLFGRMWVCVPNGS